MKSFIEGYAFGRGLAAGGPKQPVQRKLILVTFIYFVSLVIGVFMSFTSPRPEPHILIPLLDMIGFPVIYPWMFTVLAAAFGFCFMMFALVCGIGVRGATSPAELGWLGDFVALLGWMPFMFALTYDFAFYKWWGIFSGAATYFATGAVIVYVVRETSTPLPGERTVKMFFGVEIKETYGSGVYFTAGPPIPHVAYMLLHKMCGFIPLMYHNYIYPDGREHSTQLHHR